MMGVRSTYYVVNRLVPVCGQEETNPATCMMECQSKVDWGKPAMNHQDVGLVVLVDTTSVGITKIVTADHRL
jgi:hypothetical protein